MRRSVVVGFAVLFGVGGFGLGWVSSGSAASRAPTPSVVPSPRMTPEAAKLRQALVCASRSRTSSDDHECAEEHLRASWCESQLQECERSRAAVRKPWPEEDTVESPEEWVEAVEESLSECAIDGAQLELVDCTEYPCVAALRPSVNGGPDSEDFASEQKRLIDAVRGCAPLREAFGVTDENTEVGLDVFANDTTCPDGSRVDFFALMALHSEGSAYELLDDEGGERSKRDKRDLFRWLFRRGDDVAALFPCDGGPG